MAIQSDDPSLRPYFDFYFLFILLVPCVLAYLSFRVTGIARTRARYFIFCTPPLAILLVLGLKEAAQLLVPWISRLGTHLQSPNRGTGILPAVIIAATLIVLPKGYGAATKLKDDWRGIAKTIVAVTEGQPHKKFIVYQTSFRNYPTLDYYLGRFSPDVRVSNTLKRSHERLSEFSFEQKASEIAKYDYLIVAFTHQRAQDFKNTVERLATRYALVFSTLNRSGRGILVFKIGRSVEPPVKD